jgi:hypothetical protein
VGVLASAEQRLTAVASPPLSCLAYPRHPGGEGGTGGGVISQQNIKDWRGMFYADVYCTTPTRSGGQESARRSWLGRVSSNPPVPILLASCSAQLRPRLFLRETRLQAPYCARERHLFSRRYPRPPSSVDTTRMMMICVCFPWRALD